MSTAPQGQNDASDQPRAAGFVVPVALLLPILAAATTGIVVYSSSTSTLPKPQFYEIAATVIAVLVVAFAVEDRADRLFSEANMRVYRAQLFLFLLGGELFAFLGASGVLRGGVTAKEFASGRVAESGSWLNVIAGGTTAGLVGGFLMIAVLAVGGPGLLVVSRPPRAGDRSTG
jgi:hypothetical protein